MSSAESPARRDECVVGVGASENGRVHQQRKELVQVDAFFPPVMQWRTNVFGLLHVGTEHVIEQWRTEQSQHGEVGFAVAAMGRRVD
jgi:hypothetical protein